MSNPNLDHEAESNKSHREFASDITKLHEFTPDDAFVLIVTILKSARRHPLLMLEAMIELMCATHAAGKDINVFRAAVIRMKKIQDIVFPKV